MSRRGWIGVDLDGTLALHHGSGIGDVGAPILPMLARVKRWIEEGEEVRIVTARADPDCPEQIGIVQDWLESHGLPRLDITNAKDFCMVALYDDRAVQVEPNTGRILGVAHDVEFEAGGAVTAGG